ncbi:exopolysaccharide biosynthesis protein [Pararhodobacter oceanensis]|uniref:Exopolysaccharide biosynthesis protein exod n=1 Tax=Pararhodobacter oceanensis TaxID=2172121 RepID=A0A2T8HQ67_9RHOB|nr:exopolysaccharide biosynthesis protein [Pararhodobacter oceanensis]PVH27555.1 exopolysaccharide biosynthesis protein exod [Pararhodobacter oceanensis]
MNDNHSLTGILDRLETAIDGDSITVQDVIEALGDRAFASVMLIFSLISTSPASAIPGLTALVAVIAFLLAAQMALGRDHLWLPGILTRRQLSTAKLCTGIDWLRKPLAVIERVLKARLTFLFHRPWLYVSLTLIICLTLFMPFMELVPTSGSFASAVLALFAASLLTRDGILHLATLVFLLGVLVAVWQVGIG